MMTKPSDPAFGQVAIIRSHEGHVMGTSAAGGLNKREYFAAMAMQGIIVADGDIEYSPEQAAGCAIDFADSLIRVLEKES
jgi:hypothetical protein